MFRKYYGLHYVRPFASNSVKKLPGLFDSKGVRHTTIEFCPAVSILVVGLVLWATWRNGRNELSKGTLWTVLISRHDRESHSPPTLFPCHPRVPSGMCSSRSPRQNSYAFLQSILAICPVHHSFLDLTILWYLDYLYIPQSSSICNIQNFLRDISSGFEWKRRPSDTEAIDEYIE
jgi:hypothetical protein